MIRCKEQKDEIKKKVSLFVLIIDTRFPSATSLSLHILLKYVVGRPIFCLIFKPPEVSEIGFLCDVQ